MCGWVFHSKRSMVFFFFPLNLPQSVDRVLNLLLEQNNVTLSFKGRWCTLPRLETWDDEITIIEQTDQWRSKRKEGQRVVGCPKNEVQHSRGGAHPGRALVQVRERAKILKISEGGVKSLHRFSWGRVCGLASLQPSWWNSQAAEPEGWQQGLWLKQSSEC